MPAPRDGRTNTAKVCAVCEKELLRRDRRERWNVWKRLPETFGIEVEGWGADGDDEKLSTTVTFRSHIIPL